MLNFIDVFMKTGFILGIIGVYFLCSFDWAMVKLFNLFRKDRFLRTENRLENISIKKFCIPFFLLCFFQKIGDFVFGFNFLRFQSRNLFIFLFKLFIQFFIVNNKIRIFLVQIIFYSFKFGYLPKSFSCQSLILFQVLL